MAVTIAQEPLYDTLPIGQQVIFAISEDTIVATKYKVKFIAEVHVRDNNINLSTNTFVIGTFKTTPNNAGVGIFDLRPVLETFVKPDHLGSTFGNGSRYKLTDVTHPLHLIDKFSLAPNSIKNFAIQFKVEFSDTATGSVIAPGDTGNTNNASNSIQYRMFNGVLQYDDALTLGKIDASGSLVAGNNYGYNLESFYLDDILTPGKFLSNAPTTQYARLTDYGTLPFFNFLPNPSSSGSDRVTQIRFKYYSSSGILNQEVLDNNWTNGSNTIVGSQVHNRLVFCGAFPANLRGWSTMFRGLVTADVLSYYTVVAEDAAGEVSELYTINIICPNERGYEGIRLTWLNQWGVWDYYTFNKKSVRSISTNRTSYTQLGGTWNESTFKINGYKGGNKNFRVNSSEKIKLNTGFVTEAEGLWFEELINSTEVYIVKEFSTDVAGTITNKYIDPVVVTTSSYVKKTIANNKVMQYSIEIEKSKMQRTQSV